jgi:hypothetical protein
MINDAKSFFEAVMVKEASVFEKQHPRVILHHFKTREVTLPEPLEQLEVAWPGTQVAWPVRNEPQPVIIPLTELNAELIEDVLRGSDWKIEVRIDVEKFRRDSWLYGQVKEDCVFPVYKRDDLEIIIKDNCIEFAGEPAKLIDDTVDLIADENNLLSLFDWIEEGGPFPFQISGEARTEILHRFASKVSKKQSPIAKELYRQVGEVVNDPANLKKRKKK